MPIPFLFTGNGGHCQNVSIAREFMGTDFESLIERLNAGEPIPEVESNDLRSALVLFANARATLGATYEKMQIQDPQQLSLSLEDLSERCSPNANVFAVALRGMLLEHVLKLSPDPGKHAFITERIAKMPLSATEFEDLEVILQRINEVAD